MPENLAGSGHACPVAPAPDAVRPRGEQQAIKRPCRRSLRRVALGRGPRAYGLARSAVRRRLVAPRRVPESRLASLMQGGKASLDTARPGAISGCGVC